MTLENAKVLHKQFLEIGRKDLAEQQERRYPELKDSVPEKAVQKKEVKKDGKKPKGRA